MPSSLLPGALASRAGLVVVGLALLVVGRRLFWLAVGALGFVAGYRAVESWGTALPPAASFIVAVAVGVIGMVLALVVQKVAVALAGFFLGVVVVSQVLPALGLALGDGNVLVIAAGGLVGRWWRSPSSRSPWSSSPPAPARRCWSKRWRRASPGASCCWWRSGWWAYSCSAAAGTSVALASSKWTPLAEERVGGGAPCPSRGRGSGG